MKLRRNIYKPYKLEPIKPWFTKILVSVFASLTLVTLGMAISWGYQLGIFSPSVEDIAPIIEYQPRDNSLVFDRNNQKIGELFSSYNVYTPIKDIPEPMIQAIVAVEDRNFFSHWGIDLKAILRASLNLLRTKSISQGASTITQQLVRNLLLNREKTLSRKLKEVALSLHLERHVSKDKILEIYLNALFLGHGSYGVGAAAFRYFGKKLQELDIHEHALIAGLFQSPSAYNPHKHPSRAKQRQKKVLLSMIETGYLNYETAKNYYKKPLNYKLYQSPNKEFAPYFIDYVRERTQDLLGQKVKNTGLRIYTTLDLSLQQKAKDAIESSTNLFNEALDHLIKTETENLAASKDGLDAKSSINQKEIQSLATENHSNETLETARVEAALLSTDPSNGHILTMVGGRNYNESQFNRTVHAKRSPGSAMKPVVYSYALANGYKWSDMLYVSPIAVDDYRPKNYSDSSYLTETTLLRAFYKSINTPTVEITQKLGLNPILIHAKSMGIQSPLKEEIGTVLGGSEVTMMDMARVYSTIANSGVKIQPIAITKIADRGGRVLYEAPPVKERSELVLSPQVSTLVQEGMRSVFQYGTAISQGDLFPQAVGKTGTSNHSKDNWFCGSTPDLVTIVWTGVDKEKGFQDKVSASSLALPIWSKYIRTVSPDRPKQEFNIAPGLVVKKIHPKYGFLDEEGIPMYFVEGEEPAEDESNLKVISRSGSYRGIFNR